MTKQAFSEKNLDSTYLLRKRVSKSIAKKDANLTTHEIESKINNGSYNFQDFSSFRVNKKKVLFPKTREDDIVLSKLDYNIKSIYRVKQSDRHAIVKQVIHLLKESVPKFIYRLDIKDFYESINLNLQVDKLSNDSILSAESLYLLREYAAKVSEENIKGLPRGIGLSATLSEILMRDFDELMMFNEKIYFYTRFVDDILIFSTKRINIKDEIIKFLPEGLILNWGKRQIVKSLPCKCSELCICDVRKCKCWDKCKCSKIKSGYNVERFSYLGYEFTFPQVLIDKYRDKLKVDIAPSKFKKMKNRLYLSFSYYEENGDFKLLENRVKFLTGNHYLSSSKHRTDRMKSGVYYNYIHLSSDLNSYKELDKFLHWCVKKKMKKGNFLNEAHKSRLIKYSFVSGFRNKYVVDFSAIQINRMKRCWAI